MEGKIKYDPTINFGHIITLVMTLGAIITAWVNLDKRVVVLEQQKVSQALRDKHQDELLVNQSSQIRDSLNEVRNYLQRLDTRLENIQRSQNANRTDPR